MELIKRNIHMDRTKTEAVIQFSMEDDVNIPDSKPDVNLLNLEKGELVVEEIRPGIDVVNVRGVLLYSVLYHTLEEGSRLVVLEGRIPFEEKIHMKDVTPSDTVRAEGEVEDLTVGVINSRKLNIRSLLTLTANVEELYDEEVPISLHGDEKAEYRRMSVEPVQLAVCKNDIYRIKEEISLPANYPNISQLLWSTVSLGDVEFKVMEGRILLSGDVHVFTLYEGEGEEHPVRSLETTIPFSGELDCQGCQEGMIPDIFYRLSQKELSIRPDFDGEERSICMELVLDCAIKAYVEEKLEIISDIYGVTSEITTVACSTSLRKLLARMTGKTKVTNHIHVKSGKVLSLLHSEGTVVPDRPVVVENGIRLQGSLYVKVMYITGEDESPYGCTTEQIPYLYTLEIPGIREGDCEGVRVEMEQLQVNMLDGEEMDVKAVLSFSTIAFQKIPVELISQVKTAPLNTTVLNNLPGMVIYVVKEGDHLWNIGKKYYVTVDSIRKMNELETDELKAGQKLLIVKQG